MHPRNVWESYWRALEIGCLGRREWTVKFNKMWITVDVEINIGEKRNGTSTQRATGFCTWVCNIGFPRFPNNHAVRQSATLSREWRWLTKWMTNQHLPRLPLTYDISLLKVPGFIQGRLYLPTFLFCDYSLLTNSMENINTVIIGYYGYHPVTKSPKIWSYDCSQTPFYYSRIIALWQLSACDYFLALSRGSHNIR